jgi:hypothetical protein
MFGFGFVCIWLFGFEFGFVVFWFWICSVLDLYFFLIDILDLYLDLLILYQKVQFYFFIFLKKLKPVQKPAQNLN